MYAVNDKIKWSSAAGELEGTITKIFLGLNGLQKYVPWLIVQTSKNSVMLCGVDDSLKMLKVEKV